MKIYNFIPLLLCSSFLALTSCSKQSEPEIKPTSNFLAVYDSISSEDISTYIETLSSDKFAGRLPTTQGEKLTLDYLVTELSALGLAPGNGDSYLQEVGLVEMIAEPTTVLTIGNNQFSYKTDMVVQTKQEKEIVELKDSELVFVGYGVNAPEYDWNDYAGIDVKGKTVVILVNDPGFENPESEKFQGKTMTYYGRWTYKYEEASRQGAAAAIIVHEQAPASYGWTVVANSWSGPQYGLVTKNGNADRVAIEGWLTLDAAKKVFADAGTNFVEEKALAQAGPYHKALPLAASVTVNSTIKKSTSYNVLATLPGTQQPKEHIIYSAHWDHLGKDGSKEGDQIYNGAHDNATGVAANLAIAKAYSELTVKPQRSVSFLFVTAEEQGLLGSQYYAEHPVIPLKDTVANINMDAMSVLGRSKDVAVVGMGKSELENYLRIAAQRQDRTLVQEGRPEAGSYFRSDHFSFAKQGVPALYAKAGNQAIDDQTAAYREQTIEQVAKCYHQVCDEFNPNWDLSGIVQDAQLLFDVGYNIATTEDWPQWSPSSEFQRKQN